MRVEPAKRPSSYFDERKGNPYTRLVFYAKRNKYMGKTFKEILEEQVNKWQ